MNYLNIHTDTLKSEEFIDSEPVERGTWVALLGWCASQENGGVILDCADWSSRKWQQLCGVTKEEVETQSGLFSFDGENLVITFYPIDQEKEVIKRRKVAKKNGKLGGRPKKQITNVGSENKPTLVSESDGAGSENKPSSESVKEGKGREGKERKVPPNPQGGDWENIFPVGSLQKSKTDQNRTRVLRTNEQMAFVGAWFGRKPETLWNVNEAKALRDLSPSRDEVELMAEHRATPDEYHRRDVLTLLNHWSGELDRARVSQSKKTQQSDPNCGVTPL